MTVAIFGYPPVGWQSANSAMSWPGGRHLDAARNDPVRNEIMRPAIRQVWPQEVIAHAIDLMRDGEPFGQEGLDRRPARNHRPAGQGPPECWSPWGAPRHAARSADPYLPRPASPYAAAPRRPPSAPGQPGRQSRMARGVDALPSSIGVANPPATRKVSPNRIPRRADAQHVAPAPAGSIGRPTPRSPLWNTVKLPPAMADVAGLRVQLRIHPPRT